MDKWTTGRNMLWRADGDEFILVTGVSLLGIRIAADGQSATFGAEMPAPILTEFEADSTWVVTEGDELPGEDNIIIQLNGCHLAELHFGTVTSYSPFEHGTVNVAVNVNCDRVWIK